MAALNPANPAPTIVILSGNTSVVLLSVMISKSVEDERIQNQRVTFIPRGSDHRSHGVGYSAGDPEVQLRALAGLPRSQSSPVQSSIGSEI
jgi:hypothetical protein